MKSVIIGSTGLVGSILLQQLLSEKQISEVVSVGRKKIEVQHPKLRQVVVSNLSELPIVAHDLQGDLYFCCLGTTIKKAKTQEAFRKVDFDAVLDFARIAKSSHAKSFAVVSAMGADANSKIFYNRVKGEMEQALEQIGFHQLVILEPGLLLGHRAEARLAEDIALKIAGTLKNILPESVMKKIATPADLVARRMVTESLSNRQGLVRLKSQEI